MLTTKIEATGQLLDAAIDLFLAGQWAASIHCAGAVENLCAPELVRHGLPTVADNLMAQGSPIWSGTRTEFIRAINATKDWLKHTNDKQPPARDITEWLAYIMIWRALAGFGPLVALHQAPMRPSMTRMSAWDAVNRTRIDAQINIENAVAAFGKKNPGGG